MNFWVPLVKATAENGCMQVMRRSHTFGELPHNLHVSVYHGIADADLPPGEVVTCQMEVGDVLVLMERVLHRSLPNTSDTVRWSTDLRYSRIGLPTGREETPGFIARSREHPQRVAKSHLDWLKLFEEAGIDPGERGRAARQ